MFKKLRLRLLSMILRMLKWKNPTDAIWKLIDDENAKEEPNCMYIEAWERAIIAIRKAEASKGE